MLEESEVEFENLGKIFDEYKEKFQKYINIRKQSASLYEAHEIEVSEAKLLERIDVFKTLKDSGSADVDKIRALELAREPIFRRLTDPARRSVRNILRYEDREKVVPSVRDNIVELQRYQATLEESKRTFKAVNMTLDEYDRRSTASTMFQSDLASLWSSTW
ncbi:hypothetical protein TorRG33x02_259730 [Trema orientale]|uniref:Uncharacterized protein n=1 Tax=Trema orientale TaxID=63057 RepID=A0A2P5D7B3_TREOI|nr:hypothetical protein TorRG33x02_259730 [Trema orientale]